MEDGAGAAVRPPGSSDRKDETRMATVTTPLRIGPADRGRAMTLDEFLDADIEEGYRYELARGVLEVNQVANDPHRQVVTNLYGPRSATTESIPASSCATAAATSSSSSSPGLISGRNPDLGVVLRGTPQGLARPAATGAGRRGRLARQRRPRLRRPSARSTWPTAWSNTGSSTPLSGRSRC